MQMCPYCDNIYDESEYSRCPYCSGELDDEEEAKMKTCPKCGGMMFWDDGWECEDCDNEDDSDEEDYDFILKK